MIPSNSCLSLSGKLSINSFQLLIILLYVLSSLCEARLMKSNKSNYKSLYMLLIINKSLDVLMDNSSYILIPNQSRIIIMITSKSYDKGIVSCHMTTNGIYSLKTCHSYCSTNMGIVSLIPNVINFG